MRFDLINKSELHNTQSPVLNAVQGFILMLINFYHDSCFAANKILTSQSSKVTRHSVARCRSRTKQHEEKEYVIANEVRQSSTQLLNTINNSLFTNVSHRVHRGHRDLKVTRNELQETNIQPQINTRHGVAVRRSRTNKHKLFVPRRKEEPRRNKLNTNDQILTTIKATTRLSLSKSDHSSCYVAKATHTSQSSEHTEKSEINISHLLIHPLTHILIIRRVTQTIADKIINEYNLYQKTSWFSVFFVVQQKQISLSFLSIPS